MGFLDGISSSVKKILKPEENEPATGKKPSDMTEVTDEIDVFGQDIDGDLIGDNITLNHDNLQGDEEDGFYVEVDTQRNNSLYAIMQNTYENWDEMSHDEQNALIDAVMDANPEIFGTRVNDQSEQYVTDSTRGSLIDDTTRTERMNTYIYAGDKINIPTASTKVSADSVKVLSAADSNNENNPEHVHVGTVIATPHGSEENVYTPSQETAQIENDNHGVYNLSKIVDEYFDDEANPNKAYAIALDQAKANSELVLERVNAATGDNFDDVADIPAQILLSTPLYDETEGANNELKLVDARYEDFAQESDLSSARYVDQQLYSSDVSDITINPEFEGENGEMVNGAPVYKSVEDAILANYKTELDPKDVDMDKLGEAVSTVEEGNNSVMT